MNNCLTWAVAKLRKEGGYLFMRKSRWGWFPHFLWAKKAPEDCLSYVPLNPHRRFIPPILFRGRVKQGDDA